MIQINKHLELDLIGTSKRPHQHVRVRPVEDVHAPPAGPAQEVEPGRVQLLVREKRRLESSDAGHGADSLAVDGRPLRVALVCSHASTNQPTITAAFSDHIMLYDTNC